MLRNITSCPARVLSPPQISSAATASCVEGEKREPLPCLLADLDTGITRYALAYLAHDVGRRLIEDGMPVDEAPGDGDVQPGYNIAPGHVEPVYRAIPGAGGSGVRYVLGAMKWGWFSPSITGLRGGGVLLLETCKGREVCS